MQESHEDELIERLSKGVREYKMFKDAVDLKASQESLALEIKRTLPETPRKWYQLSGRTLVQIKRASHFFFYPLYLINLIMAIYGLYLEIYEWHHTIEIITGYMSISFVIMSFFLIFSYLLQYPLSLTCLDTLDGTINKPGMLTFMIQLFVYSMELSCILSNTIYMDFILYGCEVKLFLGVRLRGAGANAMWMNNIQQHYSCCGRFYAEEYAEIPNSCCETGVCSEEEVFNIGCQDILFDKYYNEYGTYLNVASALFILNLIEEVILITVNLFKN